MRFRITRRSRSSNARTGLLSTVHGTVRTPAFMPIATKAAVKGVVPDEVRAAGADIILGNTYHLWLRPGTSVIKKAGGLHGFMKWRGPILTDSGGFQVFSLAKFRKLTERGVTFRDPYDGHIRLLTPELSMHIQRDLGSDIIMALDECTPYPATRKQAKASMDLTTRWAGRCLKVRLGRGQALFGIVQGSTYHDLRVAHATALAKLPFNGFAIGGVSVGEPEAVIHKIISVTAPHLPPSKPRYVMGIGKPHQLVHAVKQGIDLFDCVLPTRDARHGRLYVWKKNGRARFTSTKAFYDVVNLRNAKLARDLRPFDPGCPCPLCRNFSRAYLRHLFATQEPLGQRLATLHNLTFYLSLMEEMRRAIRGGKL